MYVINELSKNPIFHINQHIGFDKDILGEDGSLVQEGDGQGIDGIVFANEVLSYNDNQGVQELIFYINSQGGDVQRSLDMFNAISMSKQRTHAIITGFAFSCAGWIPLAADKVDMVEETGRWMCHMPYNPENPDEKSQFMDEVVDIISKVIANKSGRNGKPKKSQDEVKRLMKEKTYWDAERMLEEGLIDRVVNASGKVLRFEKDPITLNKSELNFYYKEYQSALNKEIQNKIQTQKTNIMPFPKVVNRLNVISKDKTGIGFNLTDDASEEVIVDAIARLENRLRAMNDDMMDKEKIVLDSKKLGEDLKNELEEKKKMADDKEKEAKDAMCQYNSMKEAYDKMELENKEMKEKEEARNKEIVAADLKFRTERATNFISKLVDSKRIGATETMTFDEVKTYLTNKAIEKFEDVATQFPNIERISAPRPKFQTASKNSENTNLNIVEKLRAENRERIAKKQVIINGSTKTILLDGSVVNA